MPIELSIFRTAASAPGLYDSFFGGLYFAVGAPMMAQVCLLVSFGLAILGAVLSEIRPSRSARFLTIFFGLLSFCFICFFLTQPWDELFVNLRHSLHLSQTGLFSFNRTTPIEGTVDFLPYVVIGLLGKLGLPMVELSFLQSGAGAVLCIFAACRILADLGVKNAFSFAFVFFCAYAPLALNGSHGFTATSFTAVILWSLYFLFFTQNKAWGWIGFALLPLFRIEGVFLSVLIWIFYFGRVNRQRMAAILPLLLTPFVLHSVWRLKTFGHAIPVPVLYKSTTNGFFFIIVGIRNFFADFVNGYAIGALVLLVPIYLLLKKNRTFTSKFKPASPMFLLEVFCVLLVFVGSYYVSGGDWLPRYWGRYFLPASLFSVILAWAFAFHGLSLLEEQVRKIILGGAIAVILLQAPWYFSAYRKMADDIFTHKKIMANIFSPETGPRHHRIHHLSQLGGHLNRTTKESDVIASSEIATIMYFAERETIDLLGVANPELVATPARKPPALVRPFAKYTELPYLIFRRVDPAQVSHRKPEFVYTFDFFFKDLMTDVTFEELTDEKLAQIFKRWEVKFSGLNGTLYDGIPALAKLGYRPVIVLYANRFCSMYFVSDTAKPDHFDRLRELGFDSKTYPVQLEATNS